MQVSLRSEKLVSATNHHLLSSHCILQHLMNSKLCFYCKTIIKSVDNSDGKQIYLNEMDGVYPMIVAWIKDILIKFTCDNFRFI